jgi:hypothetical protein
MMAGDNMMMDQNAAMNGATMNGTMTVDPATQNMMQQDMNTNAPDTNLATACNRTSNVELPNEGRSAESARFDAGALFV